MMRRLCSYILQVLFLVAAINPGFIALAQENTADETIERPQIKYKSGELRDPFVPVMIKRDGLQEQQPAELNKPKINLSGLEVQGVIWGTKMSQAIINNKVLAAGDSINGAEILSIDKKGVTLSFGGEVIQLPAPGQNSATKL